MLAAVMRENSIPCSSDYKKYFTQVNIPAAAHWPLAWRRMTSYTRASAFILRRNPMRNALLHWILSAFAVWVVSALVPGFQIAGAGSALLAALVIGLVNGTIGFFLKIVTFPITVLTFGLFLFIINALTLLMSTAIVPGFDIAGFGAAFIGAIVLCLVNVVLRAVLGGK